jgi:hypothetical protein
MFVARQGDVLIFEATIPTKTAAVARDQGRIILAYGEVTGHAHAILDREVELLSVADQVDRWLRVGGEGATIMHEEHGAIALPPGDFRVRIQREYSPEEIRRVAD